MAGLLAGLFAWAPDARGQVRRIVDLEVVTVHRDADANERTSVFVVAPTIGFGSGGVVPYVGGGAGLLSVQARLGVFFLPSDLQEPSVIARVEARPEIPVIPCFEPAIFGNVGAGYRWPLEEGPPGQFPGPGLYVMPAFDGGPAWIHRGCTLSGAPDTPLESTFFFGGTVALGLDF